MNWTRWSTRSTACAPACSMPMATCVRPMHRLERDLLVRQQAEEGARQSEQRFRDYAETASDWFWETGPDHVFTYISERLSAFGMDPAALIGKRRLDAATDREAEPQKWREHMATLERHEPFRNFEYTCRDLAGRQRHVSVNGRPVFAADGRFMGYRGTATDLTKQHEAEERLRQSQKMDAIGQLTGGVAHDFNNVLTVITGTIEILQEGMADKPATRRDRPAHRRCGDARRRDHLAASDLRAPPAAGAARDRRQRAWSSTPPSCSSRSSANTSKSRPVLADDAWSALADPSQLSAAIINLAVNARDAMPGGGKLTLETANVTRDEARCVGRRRGEDRRVRDDRGHRHRPRHSRRHPRPRVRAVLHHQGSRPRAPGSG